MAYSSKYTEELLKTKKKKKTYAEQVLSGEYKPLTQEVKVKTDIAPVKATKKQDSIFSAFDDGYDFGDVSRSILKGGKKLGKAVFDTGKEVVTHPIQSAKSFGVGVSEGIDRADTLINNAVDDFTTWISPWKDKEDKEGLSLKEFNQLSSETDEATKKKLLKEYEDKYGKDSTVYQTLKLQLESEPTKKNILNKKYTDTETYKKAVEGDLSDGQENIYGVGENVGQMLPSMAVGGIAGAGVGSAVFFTQSQQGYTEDALARGYEEKDARIYGLVMGGAELLVERVSAKIGLGVDETAGFQQLSLKNIKKTMAGEGLEEFVMPYIDDVVSYNDLVFNFEDGYGWEEFGESTEEALEGAVMGATVGVIMSAGGRGLQKVDTVIQKVNTGQEITQDDLVQAGKEIQENAPELLEEAMKEVPLVVQEQLAKDVTSEDVAVQEDIAPVQQLEQDNIPIIETNQEQTVQQAGQQDTLQVDETELKRQNYVSEAKETDSTYRKNLNEDASKFANNTTRTHEFVNTLSNVSEATGISIRLTNNTSEEMVARRDQLIENYAKKKNVSVEEATAKFKDVIIDGYKTKDGIVINVNSPKALNRLVGHEITHILEKTNGYSKLQKIAIDYAKTKNDYNDRVEVLEALYDGVQGEVSKELTSDIVGDYLFTDQAFIERIQQTDRNLFQRIYDEVKHLIKMATAGSKEARQLEQLKHTFEQVMRENKEISNKASKVTVQETKTKSATEVESNTQEKTETVQEIETDETSKVSENVEAETKIEDTTKEETTIEEDLSLSVDNKGRKLTKAQEEYFEDSKVRDENGNLLTMYHGTSSGGHTVFDPYGGRPGLFGQGSYFTADNTVAESYTEKGRGNNKQIYEVYLNITNPINMDGQANVEEWKQHFSKHIPEATFPESGTNEELYRFTLEEFENTEYDRFEVAEIMIETLQKMGYDGITHIGGGRFNQKDETRHRVYITFDSNQIKNVDNTNPTESDDIRYSLSRAEETTSIEDKINSTMTMAEAKKMIQIAFQVNDINNWHDNKYVDGDDWLNDVGVDEVATYVENTFATIENYLNPLYDRGIGYGEDFYLESILEAYQKGDLKGSVPRQATRLDTSVENDYKDDRFYAPQTIEADIELYNKANQRVTSKNSQEVYKARGQFIIAVHQKGYVEQLGLTQEEVNKKIKAWAGYSRRTLELSNKVNEGVATQNKWAGLENSSIVNTISVSNEDLSKMVKEIKGDSSNWQRQYITSTMLALDTHIDYSQLTFEFDQQQALNERNALGDYNLKNKTIRIGRGYQNTVAHEIGHYLDNKWAEDFGFPETYNLTSGLNFDSTTLSDEAKQFNKNFQMFMDDLVKSATVGYGTKATYYQNRGEVFARFVGKFVEWTKNQATNNRYGYEDKFYTDNFTERQYREFIKILQEKSMLDTTETQFSLSRKGQDIAPVKEADVFGSEITVQEAIAPLQEQIETLTKAITDLQENIAPATQDLAEAESDRTLREITEEDIDDTEGTFAFDEEIQVKKKLEIIKELQRDFNIKHTEARELYNKIASIPEVTVEDIYTELENYRKVKFQEQDDYHKSIQDYIKGTKLNISDIKKQITDYSNTYRMANMGKGLTLANSGQSIDSFYQELSELYPNEFPDTVTAEVDQLELISQAMFKDTAFEYTETLDNDELQILAERIYSDIGNTERYKHGMSGLYFLNKEVKKMTPPGELNTDVSVDEYESTLSELLTKEEYEKNASNTEQTEESVSIAEELNRLDIEQSSNLPRIESENPFDEMLDKFLKKEKKTPVPRVGKTKARNFRDTTQRLFVNEMVETDNLAKESGNKNIKFKGDMLNNVAGEIEGEIYTAQTDNEGHAIGKSISGLFAEAKKTGLYDAFNDYLEQYSNIDRHAQGKGSKTPLNVSQYLVREYEKSYPQFREWGKDVWKYGSNIRENLLKAGIIDKQFSDTLKGMYPHYVPYMENREMSNYYPDLGEAKPKGVIKRAKGGAENLLPIEDALTKYTFSSKKAIRQNQFYQEIVKTLGAGVDVGADVRTDPIELDDTLYRDETGNYLTAYVNGKRVSTRISDDLYTGLKNDLEHQIRGLEEKFALITDPVQKISEIRRNLLTSWNPMFIIRNPIMDVQDAVFNSKYTKDFIKNYPGAFVELSKANTETAKQFLTLYGSGNVMGEFSSDGTVKNSKFLKGIQKANNVMELAPRYAEFKASLDNGATIQEAMYNAREVTTNFGRGGVITKMLNKNGFTFLNVSVQGFDKFVRNFSGENGAKGVAGAFLKAGLLGVLPAVFNELAFGGDDDEEKDEDYDALPDYIKDNYYLIKTGDGEFIRIPKGRMLSVFGMTARRMMEYTQGEEDAFEGLFKNAYSQVGISNPLDSNILTPLIQAYGSENGEAWYGGDLVPSRLQDKAPEEQYDSSTDKMSIWLGQQLGISPYKLNYVIDQYSGGVGDILLPFITEEATTDAEGGEMLLAPIKDQFSANSTSDNKYASDIYSLSDEMDKALSSVKETEEYKIQDSYLYSITSEMGKLYAERREVQSDDSLSKSEKYQKVQAIQDQINSLAKEGLDNYQNISKTDNYAIVGGREFNKYTSQEGEERWGSVREEVLSDLNSMGLDLEEKSSYFKATSSISEIQSKYKDSDDYTGKKREIISTIKDTNLTDEAKAYLYDKYYASSDTLNVVTTIGMDFDSYLDFESQQFEADKNIYGKTISGSKKAKVFDYINSMNLSFEEKVILSKLQYNTYDEYNYEIIDYLNNRQDITYEEEVDILKKLGFTVDEYGNIYWD